MWNGTFTTGTHEEGRYSNMNKYKTEYSWQEFTKLEQEQNVANYSFISIFSLLFEVVERVVYNRIHTYDTPYMAFWNFGAPLLILPC